MNKRARLAAIHPEERFALTWEALDEADREIARREIQEMVARMRAENHRRQDASIAICELLLYRFHVIPMPTLVSDLGGWGSRTDVGEDVRVFWTRNSRMQAIALDGAALPDALTAQVSSVMQSLIVELTESARRGARDELAIDRERLKREHQEIISRAEQQVAVVNERAGHLQQRLDASESARQAADNALSVATMRGDVLAQEVQSLTGSLQTLREQTEAMRQEHQQVLARVSEERAAERAARERDHDQLQGQINFLTQQRDTERAELRRVLGELEALRGAAEARERVVRSQIEEAAIAKGRLAVIEPELVSSRDEVVRLRERAEALERRLLDCAQSAQQAAELKAFAATVRADLLKHADVWAWIEEQEAQVEARFEQGRVEFRLVPVDGEPSPWYATPKACADDPRWSVEP